MASETYQPERVPCTWEVKVEPAVGMVIQGDEWTAWDCAILEPGREAVGDSFRGSQFVAKTTRGNELCVDIIVTGKRPQRRTGGSYWVRCRIVSVHDGEPDTSFSGWIKI